MIYGQHGVAIVLKHYRSYKKFKLNIGKSFLSFYPPIDRSNLLGSLATQDDLADCAENISVLLTFKIAPEAFQTALARLGDIGDVRTQNVTADDVTERVVDLQSRITTAEASVDRLRGFLENAESVRTIATNAATEARMTATSGPRVLVTTNKTKAKVTEQASIGGKTSRAPLTPDMMTTI